MGTAVDERVDSELTVLLDNDEKVPCLRCPEVATHSGVLECKHSFLVCDYHTRKTRIFAEVFREAKCMTCHQLVALVSLNPI